MNNFLNIIIFYFFKGHQMKKSRWIDQEKKKMRKNWYGPKKWITTRVDQKMSRDKYCRNVRYVKLIHNQISVQFLISWNIVL